jgi:D-amino-acid oxidase
MPTPNLQTPDFSFAPPLNCIAGIRPFRAAGYRLEVERPVSHPGKFVVHNYGHGGGGISLSWGTASKVRALVEPHLATTTDRNVAVVGAGVMGLTSATRLLELGLEVTIYAEKFWPDTTSAVAGGQWAPSKVVYADRAEFKEILQTSYETFKQSIGNGFGVSERPNYASGPSPNLDLVLDLCPGLLPPRQRLSRLPFAHHTQPGYLYQTLLVEPPIFLKRLDDDLRAQGVSFVAQSFAAAADVLELQENIIVNCTGYGARQLWNDQSLLPIKGQLALLPPQPQLQYLYGQNGYMFPRSDAVVIGGSFEKGVATLDVSPADCAQLVDYLKGQFGQGPEIDFPDFHIHHPANLPDAASAELTDV